MTCSLFFHRSLNFASHIVPLEMELCDDAIRPDLCSASCLLDEAEQVRWGGLEPPRLAAHAPQL